jgi:hypothetical protein
MDIRKTGLTISNTIKGLRRESPEPRILGR